MQVAQLAEQQVQGCTARIAHHETDVLHQVEGLKQHHTDQASSLSGIQTQVEKLSAAQHASGSQQLASQLNMLESRVTDMQKLIVTHHDSGSEQVDAQLSRLEAAVTQLQTASTQDKAGLHLESQVILLKNQMQELHSTCARQQKAGSALGDLGRDVAAVKAAVCDSQTSKHAAESTAKGLQQELFALKDKLAQLSLTHTQEASKTQQPVLELERTVAELSGAVAHLQGHAQGQHLGAEALTALQHDMSDLKAQLAQLQSLHSSVGSSSELYSSFEQDVAAVKEQLSALRKQVAQQAGQDSWREEVQKLRSELDSCLRAASSAEAVVARNTTERSSLDIRFAELHAELKKGLQASESQRGSQSEVEELNERLFELRVEVQNLADDTGISIASMKRKVRQRSAFRMPCKASCTVLTVGKHEQFCSEMCSAVFILEAFRQELQLWSCNWYMGSLCCALASTRVPCA